MVIREALRTLEDAGLIRIKQCSTSGIFINDGNTKVITRSISDMIKIGNVTIRELIETRDDFKFYHREDKFWGI